MAIVSMPAEEAWKVVRRNKASRWPDPDKDGQRLIPNAAPSPLPSFQIAPGDGIFTIGSCFARNIEEELVGLGFHLPTLDIVSKDGDGATGRSNGLLNKFVTQAIEIEVAWALGVREFDPRDLLIEVGSEGFIDPFLKPGLPPVSLDRAVERRLEVIENTARLRECSTVVVTLGLVEAWFDRELDCYLNRTPPYTTIRQHPGRYDYRISDYGEIVESVQNTIDMVRRHSNPDTRFLISVSPVPLNTTFSDRDVLVANMYSKSVLRSAADFVCRKNKMVDYFPSYESVMLSPREYAWQGDLSHVRPALVQQIVARLISYYCVSSSPREQEGD